LPHPITQILEESVQPARDVHFVCPFLGECEVAELEVCEAARLVAIHAGLDQFIDPLGDVEGQFAVDLSLETFAPEEVNQTAQQAHMSLLSLTRSAAPG
jgi:hypothetical protein